MQEAPPGYGVKGKGGKPSWFEETEAVCFFNGQSLFQSWCFLGGHFEVSLVLWILSSGLNLPIKSRH